MTRFSIVEIDKYACEFMQIVEQYTGETIIKTHQHFRKNVLRSDKLTIIKAGLAV